ncbi:MAG: hypothetical protein ACI4Q5_10175 [Porcipelethomonas sp.]
MVTCSDYFNAPWALKKDQENAEKYGTCDLDTIELIEKYNDKNVDARANQLADERAEERFNIIKENFRLEIVKEANEAFLTKKGNEILTASPFITQFVDLNGQRLFRQDFIPDTFKRDPQYSEPRLEYNPYNGYWQKTYKTKSPEFVSDVNVTAGLIVNARAPGDCDYYIVNINGRDTPLIYKDGNLSTHNIIAQLQLDDTSLNEKWVAEAFRRSLCMCSNISFLTIPDRMGGNRLTDGSLIYVSSRSVIPGLKSLFPDEIKEHLLVTHNRNFDDVIGEYCLSLPKNWKVKCVLVYGVESILLPFFAMEGLKPDRVQVISYNGENEKNVLIALLKRNIYNSTVVKSFADKNTNVKKDLAKSNDITLLYTFSSTIEGRGSCEKKFTDIRLDILGENGIENPTRKVIVILTETPGSIPENLPANFLSIDEDIEFVDISKMQQLTGEFHYSLIQFLYNNQEAARQIVHNAVENARSDIRRFKNVEQTQSNIMIIATAHILKKAGIISDSEMVSMLLWFAKKSTSKTSFNAGISREIGVVVSRAICRGALSITRQYGPPFYKNDGCTAFVAEIDNSINFEADTFDKIFLEEIRSTDRRNMVLRALEEKRQLISTKDHKRDFKVKCENGTLSNLRVYSLSDSILDDKARRIVERALISDKFREPDKFPDDFYPFIRHKEYDIVAGQSIKNYSTINPFIAVSGSPGSGKTDFLMMQALQRAKNGEVVIILDPTNSFCKYEWGEHKVPKEIVDAIILFWDISKKGWPINLMDFNDCESNEQKIEKLSSLLISGSHITGSNQRSILMNVVNEIVNNYKESSLDIRSIINSLLQDKGKEGEVKKRLLSLFITVAKNSNTPQGWEKILEKRGKIFVISTGNATVKADVNPLDIVLDSFYSYKDTHRSGNVTLVLDEIKTMNLSEGAPVDIVLSKGRKLNIAAFLASQRYSNGKDRLGRVFDYCDTKFFFNPMESCIEAVSDKTRIDTDKLRCFEQGDCACVGPEYSEFYGKNMPVQSAIIGKTYRPPYVGDYDNE